MDDREKKPKASITNIYYDCLERIFDFLDLRDLVNVADTCKRLRIAAAAKFGDEHGKKHIILQYDALDRIFGIRNPVVPDEIVIDDPKFQLSLLRCFGAKILHLTLWPDENMDFIEQYINQYCADTLTSFAFQGDFGFGFTVEKPFKSLEKLSILGVDFEDMFSESVDWCPNLRHLKLSSVGFRANLRIQPLENIEKLEMFDIDLKDNFPSFVNWFPNLRHLDVLSSYISTDSIAVNFPHLEHLGIPMCQRTMERTVSLFNANQQLQSIHIHVIGPHTNTMNFTVVLNMIRAHQSISKVKITLNGRTQMSAAELSQLATDHPSMTELDLTQHQFTADNVVALLGQLNSLKKFEFHVQDERQCNRVREQLNGEWQFKHWRERFGAHDFVYYIELNRKQQMHD